MPKIIPNQTFKHGWKTYAPEVEYEVTEEDAEYFKEAGWIGPKKETSTSITLEIQDVMLGHKSEV